MKNNMVSGLIFETVKNLNAKKYEIFNGVFGSKSLEINETIGSTNDQSYEKSEDLHNNPFEDNGSDGIYFGNTEEYSNQMNFSIDHFINFETLTYEAV